MCEINVEEHYGVNVWTNTVMDKLRRQECLCLNCHCLDMDSCPVAKELYQICKDSDLALAVTRCPDFSNRKDWE